METLGSRIKFFREQNNLLQNELAAILHIAPSTLSQYESDKRVPDDETKIMIARELGTTVDVLVGFIQIKPSELVQKNKVPKDLAKLLADEEVTLNGRLMSNEDKQKILRIIEAAYWEVKEENKRKKK